MWVHYLLPILASKSGCNPLSRDLILQLVERLDIFEIEHKFYLLILCIFFLYFLDLNYILVPNCGTLSSPFSHLFSYF